MINTTIATKNNIIKWINGILEVCKNLEKKLTSITIICKRIEQITPPTTKGLFFRGTLNADLLSLRQLKT